MMLHETRILPLPLKNFMTVFCREIDQTVAQWPGRRTTCRGARIPGIKSSKGGHDLTKTPPDYTCFIQKIKQGSPDHMFCPLYLNVRPARRSLGFIWFLENTHFTLFPSPFVSRLNSIVTELV
uniref:Uncharacterized protein n=1 Tax=Lynx canadensis TaxID=61383 RepID=A0A667GSN1_LYNCA